MSPGQQLRPADLGKAGCSRPCPRLPPLITRAQKGHRPEPLTPYPRTQLAGLPAPAARHDPLPGRSRQGRLRRRCAGAARPS